MGNEYEKQAKTLNKMGDKMFKQKQYTDAMKYYIESVKLMETAGNTKMVKKYQDELDNAIRKKAEELNDMGDQALKSKEYEKAIKIYDEAWQLLQKAGEKWINKRGKEFQKELLKSKIEYAENVLKPAAEAEIDKKNWNEAVTQYKKLCDVISETVDPKKNKAFVHDLATVYERWAEDVNNQGDQLYKDKNYEKAIEKYAESVQLIDKSDDDKKKKNFRKELAKAFEEHAQEINNIGDRLWKEKNYAKAAELYSQSVKIATDSGNTKLVDKFTKEMEKAYTEYAKDINEKGDALFKEKKWEEAADIYAKSVEVAVDSNSSRLVRKFSDEYEKAMERWANDVNSAGDDAMKAKDYGLARKNYEEALAIIMRTKNESRIKNYTKEYHKACVKLADEINSAGDEKYKADEFEKAFEFYDKSVKLAEIAEDDGRIKKYTKERNKALQKME